MNVVAIDPGYEVSAWVLFDGARVVHHAIESNAAVLGHFRGHAFVDVGGIVFEGIESFGMAVGREVFETVFWTGRMFEAAADAYDIERVHRMFRKEVKRHLCNSARAQDSNIRTAILDRFGGKLAAMGLKRTPGPLHGIKSHEWSALAIAVTWWDQHAAVAAEKDVSSARA